jgi:hypothetical protein
MVYDNFTTEVAMMNETIMHWRNEILHTNYETCCRINFIISNKALLRLFVMPSAR